MVHCCGSDAGGEAGLTLGRTSQPMTSLQHKELSKGWLFGLSRKCLVLILSLHSGAVSHTQRCFLVLWDSTLGTLYPISEGPVESNTGCGLGPPQVSIEAHKQGINLQELNISSCQPGRDLLRWLTLILMETVCRNHKLKSRRLCQKSRLHKSKWQTPSGFFCSLQRTHHYFQLLRTDTAFMGIRFWNGFCNSRIKEEISPSRVMLISSCTKGTVLGYFSTSSGLASHCSLCAKVGWAAE